MSEQAKPKMPLGHKRVLSAMAANDGPVPFMHIPNGHGHVTARGPSPRTVNDLGNAGLISRDVSGYRITDLGRAALAGAKP